MNNGNHGNSCCCLLCTLKSIVMIIIDHVCMDYDFPLTIVYQFRTCVQWFIYSANL